MGILDSLESMIAGAVEGTFSRLFRSEVRPVEIARKLAREMEEHRSHSLSRTYVPNEYKVFLSPRDRDRFSDYEDALGAELGGYLLEHARREGFALVSSPVITFESDDRLGLGEFGIQTRNVRPAEEAQPEREPERERGADPGAGNTMIYSTAARLSEPLRETAAVRNRRAFLVHEGRRLVIGADGLTIGRSRSCDIVVDDPNVSRRHAEVRPRGGSWIVTDLGSTNGSLLNHSQIHGSEVLKPGDEIEVGSSLILFEFE
jgi:hypothetical protein